MEIFPYLEGHPESRSATILAARFLVERLPSETEPSNFTEAVATLTKFLAHEGVSDIDSADVMFNRGCYFVKMAETKSGAPRKEEYIKNAIEDITVAVRKKPENKETAAKDEWLESISTREEFIDLISPLMYEAKDPINVRIVLD
jgi:hypothetical protein